MILSLSTHVLKSAAQFASTDPKAPASMQGVWIETNTTGDPLVIATDKKMLYVASPRVYGVDEIQRYCRWLIPTESIQALKDRPLTILEENGAGALWMAGKEILKSKATPYEWRKIIHTEPSPGPHAAVCNTQLLAQAMQAIKEEDGTSRISLFPGGQNDPMIFQFAGEHVRQGRIVVMPLTNKVPDRFPCKVDELDTDWIGDI